MKYCPHCGAALRKNEAVCPKCGRETALFPDPAARKPVRRARRIWIPVLIVLALLLAALLGMAAGRVLSGGGPSEAASEPAAGWSVPADGGQNGN